MLAGRNGARGRIRTRTGDALDVVSLLLDYASDRNGASTRSCTGTISLQRKSTGCCKVAVNGEWSQSPVLPRTRRAYETHLSAKGELEFPQNGRFRNGFSSSMFSSRDSLKNLLPS